MNPSLLVGTGGVLGALARHLVSEAVETNTLDTLVVNVLGSFLLGAFVSAPVDGPLLLLAGTGFCGAFTTFSTFAFETVRAFERGERRTATINAAGNLAAALVAVALGSLLVAQLG